MVAFAPTVPSPNVAATADPEYTSYRWSRPISPFEGNKSSEIALKGAGEALGEGAKAGEQILQSHIQQGIESEAGGRREEFKDTLENTLSSIRGDGRTAYASAEPDGKNKLDILTTPQKDDNTPKDIKNLGGMLDKMVQRRDNGSISETKYRGDIDAMAKQWRAAWPGQVDKIDSEFDRVTERGVANDYIKSMVGDLNAYQAAAKEGRSKVESLLQHAQEVDHIPGADKWDAWYKNGTKSEPEVRSWYNQTMSFKFKEEQAKAAITMSDLNDKNQAKLATNYMNSVGTNRVREFMLTLDASMQPDKMLQEIRDNKIDSQHAELAAVNMDAAYQQMRRYAVKDAMDTKDKNGVSIFQKMGAEKLNAELDKNPELQYFKGVVTLLGGSKDHSVSLMSASAGAAQIKDDEYRLQTSDSPLGRLYRANKVWAGSGVGGKLVADTLETGSLVGDARTWMNNGLIVGAAQPDHLASGDPNDIVTIKSHYDEAVANGKDKPTAFKALAEKVGERISDPNVPIQLKAGYMNMAYDGKNLALMESLQRDHVDPQTGKNVAGKVWFYKQLTSQAQADQVHSVAQALNKPELWDNYQNYVSKAGEYIVGDTLAGENSWFKDLHVPQAVSDAYTRFRGSSLTPEKMFQFSYDNENTAFKVDLAPKGFQGQSQTRTYLNEQLKQAQESVKKVNTVLQSVKSMAQYSGMDPDTYMHNLLVEMAPSDPLINQMLTAIQATAPKKEEPKK